MYRKLNLDIIESQTNDIEKIRQYILENSKEIPESLNNLYDTLNPDEVVTCDICYSKRRTLVTHIPRFHNISNSDYKRIFGKENVSKLEHERLLKTNSDIMKNAWLNGKVNLDTFRYGKERLINADEQDFLKISDKIKYVGGVKKVIKVFGLE